MEVIGNVTDVLFSSELLSTCAHYYASLPMFPLFNTVHFILTALALRSEEGSLHFAFAHPVASCVMTFIVASSGGILANIMVGRPPLECLTNGWSVSTAVLCWYIVFFSPYDIVCAVCTATPVQLVLSGIEEFARARKVFWGVTVASKLYPGSLVAMAFVGMLKGSGKRWSITWYRLIYRPQSASNHELLGISFITKAAFFLGLVMAFNHSQGATFPSIDEAHLQLLAAVLLTFLKFWSLLFGAVDPFSLPQQATWRALTTMAFPPPKKLLVSEIGSTTGSKGQSVSPVTEVKDKREEKTKSRGEQGPSIDGGPRQRAYIHGKDKAD